MRKVALVLALAALSAPIAANAGPGRGLGLGVGFGSPTTLNLKYFFDRKTALDVGLILGRYYYGGVGLHGDVLFHLKNLAAEGKVQIPFYLGVGVEVGTWNDSIWDPWRGRYVYRRTGADLALRVPIGLAVWLRTVPLELYTEIGPSVWLLSPVLNVFGTLGLRYYF